MTAKYVDGALQLDGETYPYDSYNRADFDVIDIAPKGISAAAKAAFDAFGVVSPGSPTLHTYEQKRQDGSVQTITALGLQANLSVSGRLRTLGRIGSIPALASAAKWLGRVALPSFAIGASWS